MLEYWAHSESLALYWAWIELSRTIHSSGDKPILSYAVLTIIPFFQDSIIPFGRYKTTIVRCYMFSTCYKDPETFDQVWLTIPPLYIDQKAGSL
jgi:hypothetical protein